MNKYVIGLDYGSDSARAIDPSMPLRVRQVASSVKYYPRWEEGKYCDPAANRYRQHPLDYIEVLESSRTRSFSPPARRVRHSRS